MLIIIINSSNPDIFIWFPVKQTINKYHESKLYSKSVVVQTGAYRA